jgi:hypothetical protein
MLALAEDHLRRAQLLISEQEKRIVTLRDHRHPTDLAESLLAVMKESAKAMAAHKQDLEADRALFSKKTGPASRDC